MDKLKRVSRKAQRKSKTQPKQPGKEHTMSPLPFIHGSKYKGSNKLLNKVAIITGGDSGIGHAVAIFYAKEGADVVICYLNEDKDARLVKQQIENLGRNCLLLKGDVSKENICKKMITQAIKELGKIDILVNNVAQQFPQKKFESITRKQLVKTFEVNIFSFFYMTQAAMPYMKKGSVIINTTSVTAYKGNKNLIDYSATKGAIVAFTRSLSMALIERGIRVNAVAPGPIWTPLIPASFDAKHLKEFGDNTPIKRMGQPEEIAPCYVFLAADDSSYMSGQVLHPNGGVIVNG